MGQIQINIQGIFNVLTYRVGPKAVRLAVAHKGNYVQRHPFLKGGRSRRVRSGIGLLFTGSRIRLGSASGILLLGCGFLGFVCGIAA